jgi:homoserine O-acetyltransferase
MRAVTYTLAWRSQISASTFAIKHIRTLATVSPSRPTQPREIPKFPCVEAHATREKRILSIGPSLESSSASKDPSASGPEPPYARPSPTSYQLYHHAQPFQLIYSPTPLPKFSLAYETWGALNSRKSNAILLHTGLSASSHAASTNLNPAPGWWQKFIGPGKALDTNQFFVICANVLGGCYGSTGPSSPNPVAGDGDGTSPAYGTNFPILSIWDIVRAQWHLIDHLGIEKLYASVGSSMGGMSSLATGW